jgi:hypothetical protein
MVYPISPYLVVLCTIGAALLLSWRIHELLEKPLLRSNRPVKAAGQVG